MTEKSWYTPEELATKHEVKPKTVLKWIGEGKLPALKVGGRYRLTDADWSEFIRRCNP